MAEDAVPPASWPEPIGALLGTGGFASVWELPGNRVLKIAHASHDLARARLAREALAMTRVGAPAVPRIDGHGVTDDGRAWIAMERIDGKTLAALVKAGPLALPEIVSLAQGTLTALEKIHAAHFVHRDLKPENIVQRTDGSIVILDLGLARIIPEDRDDPTRANVQVGSLEYMAPEQLADSASVDERSDLYAFGCVLFELCARRPPFAGDAAALERAHAALRPPPLSALASVPAELESLVSECLAKDRDRRPATAAAARARLAEVLRVADEPHARSMHSISLIGHGKQPVVLLFAELPKVDRALLAIFGARRLVVVSQRGRRVLAGVLGGDHADPATVAVATARDLAAAGAKVALHLDALRVETVAGASTLQGEAVEKPEAWLPAQPWTGIVLSRALASVTQAPTRASELGEPWRALSDEQAAAELFGREVLLTDLVADAAAALAGVPAAVERSGSGTWRTTGPAFALLVGDAGVGKTAFASELAARIRELGPRVHLATVPAPGTGKPSHSALAELIGPLPAGAPVVRAVGDALRAAARDKATAVVLDDLHLADTDLLDALEYATLGGERLPLWVLGVAAPRVESKRPQLGARAERHRRDVLQPLEEDAAIALAAQLLKPAEYPPLRALRRLASIARGNPLHLAMLAREIHERGAVRARPGGAPFLDTTALDDLPPAALGPWLAARELGHLSAELVSLARLCAVLGGEFARAELGAIVEAVEKHGGATTTIDVDVGLAELERAGVLASSEHGFRFRQTLVEEGIYATTNEAERHALHEAALAYWCGAGGDPAQVARHAEAAGARTAAAQAYAQLGERAYREQRMLDADEAYSGAIRHLDARDRDRGRALVGRARARYQLQRVRDALTDLDEALAIARELSDPALEARVLIEQATAHDWGEDFAASQAAAEQAAAIVPALADRDLSIEVELATGRTHFRHQEPAAAVTLLREVWDRARAAQLGEVATIAGALLGPTLVVVGELDEAATVFGELIALCEARRDRFYLAVAYVNRAWLWQARGEVARTADDLRYVIQVAREVGLGIMERHGAHNLGENKLWEGALDEALQLARRCLAIQRAHAEGSTVPDRLLVARVLAARGDLTELTDVLASFAGEDLAGEDAVVLTALRAIAQRDPAGWQPVLAKLDEVFPQLRLELGQLAVRAGALSGPPREALIELARGDAIWRSRVDEL